MWPKAIAQLIELAPHIARLLPMADRFFVSKSAEQDAARTAMEQMADGLRGDLAEVAASHAGLYRQLNDQSEKLSNLSADLRSTKLIVEANEAQLALLQKEFRLIRILVIVALVLMVVLLAVFFAVPLHH
jgi:septal ring factor EnvC (AmiA/AmiB activator)